MVTALALVVLLAQVAPTGASWGAHVLVADGAGGVRAWAADGLAFDAALTKTLSGDGLVAIVRDGDVLWGFDGKRVFTRDEASARWTEAKSKPPAETCSAFTVVDGKPVGTCGAGVHRFTDGKYWRAPAFADQIKGRGFGDGPQSIASHGTQLAIGTGYGEWGGHLWLLDVSTGVWGKHYDSRGNAVGIAWNGQGWAVAWSMSHMMSSTRLRVHGVDARPVEEGERLVDKYLRTLAFDSETKTLFGIEQDDLVKVGAKLAFARVQGAGKVKYGPERNAMGVSGGISQLLALGGGKFLIVPKAGEPLVLAGGKVFVLAKPAPGK